MLRDTDLESEGERVPPPNIDILQAVVDRMLPAGESRRRREFLLSTGPSPRSELGHETAT